MKAVNSNSPDTYAIGDITKDELMGLYIELQHYEVSTDSFAMRLRQCIENAFYCEINSVFPTQNDETLPSYYREIKEKSLTLEQENDILKGELAHTQQLLEEARKLNI